ncbi:MAG: NUDIX domain-containing protein [Anaerolineales bacterium]|nr:NUDIX domain-containing protein [Anaerolineales bacterium]
MSLQKNSHCSFCGAAFTETNWPRTCAQCGNVSFLNPVPVTVLVVPVEAGVLTVRRNIEPRKGALALPGGYINYGETWQAAGAREVFEETGLRVNSETIRLVAVHSATNAERNPLIFGVAEPLPVCALAAFTPNEETSELVVVHEPVELAFPLHTQVLVEFLTR